jgi:hypothetical protein
MLPPDAFVSPAITAVAFDGALGSERVIVGVVMYPDPAVSTIIVATPFDDRDETYAFAVTPSDKSGAEIVTIIFAAFI